MSEQRLDEAGSGYQALRSGSGLAAGVHEAVWVRGPDAIEFLDGLISQDVAAIAPGRVAHSLLLAPNGKLRAPLVLWRGEDEVVMIATAGAGQIVHDDLSRFRIRVDVTIEIEQSEVLDVIGPDSASVLATAGYEVPGPNRWSGPGPTIGWAPYVHGGPDRLVVIGADADAIRAAGAVMVDQQAVEMLRIERGEPLVGRDVGDGTIPQEMGTLDHAVSFTKGCYLGQELVARIDSRGHVNRHLRGLTMVAGPVPAAGAVIEVGGKAVGEVTSAATSPALGSVVALAMVRREVDPGATVDVVWDDRRSQATVRALPLT